jgi:hypothetical protein
MIVIVWIKLVPDAIPVWFITRCPLCFSTLKLYQLQLLFL